jgi:adenine-specific DNA-methyltransferase
VKQWAPRSFGPLTLRVPELLPGSGRAVRGDACALASTLGGFDLAYLDPPYNQHPYGSNYHVLNTVALWDDPPATNGIEGFGGKSAIRLDWRTARRSAYNSRASATQALDQLLETVRARHILISYSTDGLIPLELLVDAACRRGVTVALTSRYKRYRVSSQRYSSRGHNVEFVLAIDAGSRPNPAGAAEIVEQIRGAADEVH